MSINQPKLAGFTLSLCTALALLLWEPFKSVDLSLLDTQFRLLHSIAEPLENNDILIVGIDETTFNSLPEPFALWHKHLGAFLSGMAEAGARLVGFDVVLPSRSYNGVIGGLDQFLLQGLLAARQNGTQVVLGVASSPEGEINTIHAPFVSLAGAQNLALIMLDPDEDLSIRRTIHRIDLNQASYAGFAAHIAASLGYAPQAGLIDYRLSPPFSYIAFHELLKQLREEGAETLHRQYAGKIVLLGSVVPYEDRHQLPVNLDSHHPDVFRLPGVLAHAQMLRTFMQNTTIHTVPLPVIAGLSLITCLLWWFGAPFQRGLLLFVGGLLLLAIAALACLHAGYYLPTFNLSLSAAFALVTRGAYEGYLSLRERQRLTASFSKYVSPAVMSGILDGNIHPESAGQRCHVAVLFSDIRGFTRRSEHTAPEAIVELLNRYLDLMTQAVHRHEGTIDKFMGDGLMAFFGAPNRLPDSTCSAMAAAVEMLDVLAPFNEQLKTQGIEEITIGIGLHYGEVLIGHVGSCDRHEYTAIGDVVNLTSRLEGLSKALDYPLICSDQFAAKCRHQTFDKLGIQNIKGRAPIKVYGWPARNA